MFSPLLDNPKPNFAELVEILEGHSVPHRVPTVELFLDEEIQQAIIEGWMCETYVPLNEAPDLHYKQMVDLYFRLGFDYVPLHHWQNFINQPKLDLAEVNDTAQLSRGKRGYVVSGRGCIKSRDDLLRIPWNDIRPDYTAYDLVIPHLPEGMKIVSETTFFQAFNDVFFGHDGFGYMLYDDPELVADVIQRWGEITLGLIETVANMDSVGAIFHADDMGHKTNTFVSPQVLRRLIFPWLAKFVAVTHRHGKMFWLHCCGNIYKNGVIEDLLESVGVDAFHSFQDVILPVEDFKTKYGHRVATLGGIDMDKLCILSDLELREYIRGILSSCMPTGRYAFGSGNSITNYVPLENYFILLDEARSWTS